jgi:hypothetical protein
MYVIKGFLRFRYVLDKSLAVYLVPYEENGRFKPGAMIDDNPTDGFGMLEHVYRLLVLNANTTWKWLPKRYTNFWYVRDYYLIIESESAPLFGVSIPVGALIIAITGNSPPGWALSVTVTLVVAQITWYQHLSNTIFATETDRCFNPRYLRLTAFLIKEAGDKYYPTPLMIVWPYTTSSC